MKKLVVVTLVIATLILAACLGIYNVNKKFDYYANASPIAIEQTYWYLEIGNDGIPWYYLYIKATNTSDKDIKSAKSYCGFNIFWYNENGEFGGGSSGNPWGDVLQLDWLTDGYWKAGEKQIFRIPVMSIEYESDSTRYMINTISNSSIMPYWVNYTGFGSWGEKELSIFDARVNNSFIAQHAIQIPDFSLLENN